MNGERRKGLSLFPGSFGKVQKGQMLHVRPEIA